MSQPRCEQKCSNRSSSKQTDNRILFRRHNTINSHHHISERFAMQWYQRLPQQPTSEAKHRLTSTARATCKQLNPATDSFAKSQRINCFKQMHEFAPNRQRKLLNGRQDHINVKKKAWIQNAKNQNPLRHNCLKRGSSIANRQPHPVLNTTQSAKKQIFERKRDAKKIQMLKFHDSEDRSHKAEQFRTQECAQNIKAWKRILILLRL